MKTKLIFEEVSAIDAETTNISIERAVSDLPLTDFINLFIIPVCSAIGYLPETINKYIKIGYEED